MANLDFSRIKQAPWKVDVFDRLSRVKSDIKRGIGVKGWSLVEQDGSWTISPSEDQLQDNQERELRGRALAVVTVIYDYDDNTRECLKPPRGGDAAGSC